MAQETERLFTAQEMREAAKTLEVNANDIITDCNAQGGCTSRTLYKEYAEDDAKFAAMLRQGADLLESDAPIERVVRDAIQSYSEMFPAAPNDDCERELRERAGWANAWLTAHGFAPEPFHYDAEQPYIKLPRKEEKDGQDDGCGGC